MDQLLVNYAGSSCALGIYPACGFYCVSNTANHDADSSCTRVPSTADSPFGDSWVMSIGFACTMLVVVPLSFLNLDDNIGVQIVSFMCLLAITIEWIWQFRPRRRAAVRRRAPGERDTWTAHEERASGPHSHTASGAEVHMGRDSRLICC